MKKEHIFRVVLIVAVTYLVIQFGFLPLLNKDLSIQGQKNNSWAKGKIGSEPGKYDVVVVGEETEGIAAAISAARLGAKTLLLSEGNDLGGMVSKAMIADFQSSVGPKKELLNRGIYKEFHNTLGEQFSIEKYLKLVSAMVKAEGSLDTILGVNIEEPILTNNAMTGINITVKNKKQSINGKIFIDATKDGKLLMACRTPYFIGSEDVNLKQVFASASLNFEMDGINWEKDGKDVVANIQQFYFEIAKYQPSTVNISIKPLQIIDQGKNKVVVQGLTINKLDVTDEQAIAKAYQEASAEAQELAKFLSKQFIAFKKGTFHKVADSLYIPEKIHYTGEYTLGINDIIENRDFDDKIAIGSKVIDGSKLTEKNNAYVIGKPVYYGIPLQCLIPLGTENLFMVGSKISYASLAASSAGAMDVSIATGEAAGVVAVYALIHKVTPRELVKSKDANQKEELAQLLKRQGVYLPAISVPNKNASNWAFPAVRELLHLGLLAGNSNNDYVFANQASQDDFAKLLLNGIYRLSPGKYSLNLDARLRPYFIKEKLTKEKAGEILASLYGISVIPSGAYEKMSQLGHVNNELQLHLKTQEAKKVLTMDEVYYLSAYTIKAYTGRDILN